MKIDSGKIGSIPLIIAVSSWTFVFGLGGLSFRILERPFLSFRTVSTILLVIPLVLMCLAIWFPNSKLRLYLGRIGSIIWMIPMGFYSLMIFGEIEHAEPIALLIYCIVIASTILVMKSLWKPKSEEKGSERK